MRIINGFAVSAALLALTSSVTVRGDDGEDGVVMPLDLDNETPGPHDFNSLNASTNPGKQAKGKGKGQSQGQANQANAVQGGFSVRGAGGRLRLCPTGDCKQSIVDISMHHLREVMPNGTVTTNRIKNFMGLTYNWTQPVMTMNAEGVNVTTSRFNASLPIDGIATPVNYTAEVSFYDGNGTSMNGNQTIDVPGGGLKFAVWIDSWPFLDDNNTLNLGLRIISQNKKGGKAPKGTKKGGQGRDKKIDRVELAESMFFDSPVLADVDGTMMNISSNVSVNASANYLVIEYAFPKFTKLYYDPVASSTDSTDTTGTTGSTTGSTTGTTTTTPTPGPTTLRSLALPQSHGSLAAVLAAFTLSALALVQF